ncbi:hypothetical protein K439DRAFT_1621866 [Ramaria rubella]|nr:hypothetical protein K439DRAFT_1621866 [Ramaria rubella]
MAISAFANYSTPDPKTRFSEAFFESLTFNEVQALVLPKILSRNSLHGWTWETAPPEGKFMSILEPTDYIPHIQDLQDILRNVEHLYGDEMRGVSLTLYTLLGVKTIHAHFSLLHLFVSINNHLPHVEFARLLIHQLTETLLIPASSLLTFQKERIMARCAGFSTAAAMQLWEFGTLPGKTWLHDEMINAQSEFVHFRCIARNALHQVEYFSLSTYFYEEVSILYNQTPQVYNMNLINIRARLHSGTPRPANPKIINVLAWVFNGLDIPIPKDIATADGPQQPTGSGSCAIVVHNYLEHFSDPAQSLWTPARSQVVRNEWLHDVVLYHLCAVGKGVFSSWTRPFAGDPGLHHIPPGSPIPRLVVPYQDYCMFEIEHTLVTPMVN